MHVTVTPMIRSLSAALLVGRNLKNIPVRKLIRHSCTPSLVKHVARISSTCIGSSGANPGLTAHGSQTQFTLDIKLPDLATEPDLPGPEIPSHFQPSSHTRGTSSIRHDADHEAPMRPIFVVAGVSSQQSAGGPTYEEQHPHSTTLDQSAPSGQAPSPRTGLWADLLEDICIPPDSAIANPFRKQSGNGSLSEHPLTRDKPLNEEEKRGLRALLVIFAGLWLAGSFGKPKSKSKSVHI